MKKLSLLAAVSVAASMYAQTTFAQWNFNNSDNAPAVGTGSVILVGGTTATYASGSGSTDTAASSKALNTTGYPAAGTGSMTAGIQFNVNTTGHYAIQLNFDQRLSNTAANTYVVQYSTNVAAANPVWVDAKTFTFTPSASSGDTWYNNRTVTFDKVAALNNNPNAGFRILSAFDPAAKDYVAAAAGKTYAATGTVRYDMVTVSDGVTLASNETNASKSIMAYPGSVKKGDAVHFQKPGDVVVMDASGRTVAAYSGVQSIPTAQLGAGVYLVKFKDGKTARFIVK